LPKTVTRQRRGCDLNPGLSAPESSTLTTRLASHHRQITEVYLLHRERRDLGTDLLLRFVCVGDSSFVRDVMAHLGLE